MRMTVFAVPIVFASLLFVPYIERIEQRAKDPYRSFARSLRSEGDRRADTTRSVTGLLKREVSYLSAWKWNGKEDVHQQPEASDLQHGIRPVEGPPAEQIVIVLHVAVILRAVADTCLVTRRPKELKKPMENAMATDEPRTRGLVPSAGKIEEQRAGGD